MIKALLWDNDGVLVDTERLFFRASQQILETIGVSLDKDQYVELFLRQGKGLWPLAEAKGLSRHEIEKLRQERNAIYNRLLQQEELAITGVRETLEALHKKFIMGIVTSSEPEPFAIIHQKTGFLPYFQFTVTPNDYTHFKPHPEPYLLAIERSGCSKDECLVIEDSERGLIAATAAGLKCVVIPTDLTRHGNFDKAFHVLESLSELTSCVNDL